MGGESRTDRTSRRQSTTRSNATTRAGHVLLRGLHERSSAPSAAAAPSPATLGHPGDRTANVRHVPGRHPGHGHVHVRRRRNRAGRRPAQPVLGRRWLWRHAGHLLDPDHHVRRHQPPAAHWRRLAARRSRRRQGRHTGSLRVDRAAVQERPGRRVAGSTWAAAATSPTRSLTPATARSTSRLWLHTCTGNVERRRATINNLRRPAHPRPDVRRDVSRRASTGLAGRLHRPGQRQQPLLPHPALRHVPARSRVHHRQQQRRMQLGAGHRRSRRQRRDSCFKGWFVRYIMQGRVGDFQDCSDAGGSRTACTSRCWESSSSARRCYTSEPGFRRCANRRPALSDLAG